MCPAAIRLWKNHREEHRRPLEEKVTAEKWFLERTGEGSSDVILRHRFPFSLLMTSSYVFPFQERIFFSLMTSLFVTMMRSFFLRGHWWRHLWKSIRHIIMTSSSISSMKVSFFLIRCYWRYKDESFATHNKKKSLLGNLFSASKKRSSLPMVPACEVIKDRQVRTINSLRYFFFFF